MSDKNNNENGYITFLKIFEELLENAPSIKVKMSKVKDVKSEMFKTSRDFNVHVFQK